jgi:hypothetical protein
MMNILMPKKTLALISGLVVVTIVLFIIALRAGQQTSAPSIPQNVQPPTPMVPSHTVLQVGPNPLTIAPGQLGHADIMMNTSDNDVTAVQLEIGYDPRIISNVKVTPGAMFTNPVVLIDKNNPTTGRYTYAFGITPNAQAVKGSGVVATVTFTPVYGAAGKQMQLGLLPTSLVTARGVAQSVLKSTSGTVLTVSGSTGPAMTHTTSPVMTH